MHDSAGQFSRLTRLSRKALPLYKQHGLLVAAKIDPKSGYRRYSTHKIATARLIRMMRMMEMSLALIGELLDAPNDIALIRRHQQAMAARLRCVDQATVYPLAYYQKKEISMIHSIQTKQIAARRAVVTEQRILVMKFGRKDRSLIIASPY